MEYLKLVLPLQPNEWDRAGVPALPQGHHDSSFSRQADSLSGSRTKNYSEYQISEECIIGAVCGTLD